ncbi:MAG: transposase [Archaeoglobaceae archaeon]
MRRTNTFKLRPTRGQERRLFELADSCSRLWNEVTYKRRQTFFEGEMDWNTDEYYRRYKKPVGSATAQQVVRKSNEAWKSFFALLKQYDEGKLPPHIEKVSPPGYWKDRDSGERYLKVLVRCDSYKLDDDVLKFNKLKIKWSGKNRWQGKQGRLEIVYDRVSGQWYAYQPVSVSPAHQPIGDKRAYVDLGVRVPVMANIEGDAETFGYSGNPLLSDWWYWTNKISECQSELKKVNDKHKSKRLSKLYRKRRNRFRHQVNCIVKDFVERCYHRGVSEIVMGALTGIRNNGNSMGEKSNSMVHNFWSHSYLIQRIEEKAEEHGIRVTQVNERGTSSQCPKCGSTNIVRRGRLFKCKSCGLEAHRDAVGSVNISIGLAHSGGEVINRAVACPLLSEAGTSHAC